MLDKLKKRWLLTKYRKRVLPSQYQTALEKYLEKSSQNHLPDSLTANRFVVLDTETNGTSASQDNIISIGAVGIRQRAIHVSDAYECLVKQERAGKENTLLVHGLLKTDIQEGMEEKQALIKLLEFIGGDILVMHHASFDKAFLNAALKKHFGIKLLNPWIDTLLLALRLENNHLPVSEIHRDAYTLDALGERYQLPIAPRHTASGDAYTTALLFLKLMADAEKRGIGKVKEMLNGHF